MIQFNVYDALACMYEQNIQYLSRIKSAKDTFDADAINHEITTMTLDAHACRVKAQSVKPTIARNDKPTLDEIKRRVATIGNVNLREYDGGYALLDVATQQFLPPMPILLTLKEISAILDYSGVDYPTDSAAALDDAEPF